MELLVFSTLLSDTELAPYPDLAVLKPSQVNQAQRLIEGDRAPDALYLDDSRSLPPDELWRLVQVAQAKAMKVFVNSTGSAGFTSVLNNAKIVGIPTAIERDPAAVMAWLAGQLGMQVRSVSSHTPILAIGAAKGGIGKTFATATLAEGLRRRGLNILVWDSDISNPGLVPAFRIPSNAPSYLHLIQRGPSHWNPSGIKPFIFQPDHTGPNGTGWGRIDFLIGSHTVAKAENDVRLPDWQGLYAGVAQLDGYDLIIIDTPPDYLRRPYATHTLQQGGTVILPCPPGARERMGVAHMLDHFRQHVPDRLPACSLLFMEPEKGVITTIKSILPMFAGRYPDVKALGTLPRAPKLASTADEHDGYISMLELGPSTPFAQATHAVGDNLIVQLGLSAPLGKPKIGAWATLKGRLSGDKPYIPAPNTSVGALARAED